MFFQPFIDRIRLILRMIFVKVLDFHIYTFRILSRVYQEWLLLYRIFFRARYRISAWESHFLLYYKRKKYVTSRSLLDLIYIIYIELLFSLVCVLQSVACSLLFYFYTSEPFYDLFLVYFCFSF